MGHHFVQQKYLAGFATDDKLDCVFQFDKTTREFSSSPIHVSKVAQKQKFNDDDVEIDLGPRIELPNNPVLEKLRSHDLSLSKNERLIFARYIAAQWRRVPTARELAESIAKRSLTQAAYHIEEQIVDAQNSGAISKLKAESLSNSVASCASQFSNTLPPPIHREIKSPFPTSRMVEAVLQMVWRFVIADKRNTFVTSDNPVFTFQDTGLKGSTAELVFPISSKLALFASNTPLDRRGVRNKKQSLVKLANRRIIAAAGRFVFSPSRFTWIAKISRKTPPTNRLTWK